MFEQSNGKTKTVSIFGKVLLHTKERSLCLCCGKQKGTTVNGVCLDCQQSDKKRPVGRK